MSQFPEAIVIFLRGRAYMTVRDFLNSEGNPPSDPTGNNNPPSRPDDNKPARAIEPLSDKFGREDVIDPWLNAVDQKIQLQTDSTLTHAEVIGNLFLPEAGEIDDNRLTDMVEAAKHPAISLVKMAKDQSDPFLVRWLSFRALAIGQELSAFAIFEKDDPAIEAYHSSLAAERSGSGASPFGYDIFLKSNLVPVYSSVTISMPSVLEVAGPGSGSDSGGEGFE